MALSEPIYSKNNDIIEGVRNPDVDELTELNNYLNE
jgi:hypothetical protein